MLIFNLTTKPNQPLIKESMTGFFKQDLQTLKYKLFAFVSTFMLEDIYEEFHYVCSGALLP